MMKISQLPFVFASLDPPALSHEVMRLSICCSSRSPAYACIVGSAMAKGLLFELVSKASDE